jgi:hypothetical protein
MLMGGGRFRLRSGPLYRYVAKITTAVPSTNCGELAPDLEGCVRNYIEADLEVKKPDAEEKADNNAN